MTPYVWAAGIDGDVSPFRRLPTVSIEKSFSDVLEDLNVAGFVNLWARNDWFVISGDLMYVSLTESKTIGRLPIIGGIPPIGASVDTSQFAASLQAGYRFYDSPEFTFDALAGARSWRIETDAKVSFLGFSRSIQSDFDWFDPIVGARAHYHINDSRPRGCRRICGGIGFDMAGLGNNQLFVQRQAYRFPPATRFSPSITKTTVTFLTRRSRGPVLGLTIRF
ncbi:hypothetical protein [Ensifer sesbaniae]|uniref:hypothetical protein n=1 Tax=Ensifer sesbaniae TaxID=1214071 RepID=UPI001AED30D6|nr:hypothetical protein [Ensifer sesbaniae]NRQ18456.1 hypothetical protein [Ensifer sesbaniae]